MGSGGRGGRGGGRGLSHLAIEALAVWGLQEAVVDLVGASDNGGHGILVVWGGDGEEWQRGQREVVHTAGHTALVIAVRVQADTHTDR